MRLKELRKNKQMTQEEVAKALHITRKNYSNYETQLIEPDINLLKRMANFFNVSIDYLIENDEPSKIDISASSVIQKECIEFIKNLKDEDCKIILKMTKKIKNDMEANKTKYGEKR